MRRTARKKGKLSKVFDESPILNGWDEIADYLKVSNDTAMKLYKKYNLPILKVAGLVLTVKDILHLWIIKNTVPEGGDDHEGID